MNFCLKKKKKVKFLNKSIEEGKKKKISLNINFDNFSIYIFLSKIKTTILKKPYIIVFIHIYIYI